MRKLFVLSLFILISSVSAETTTLSLDELKQLSEETLDVYRKKLSDSPNDMRQNAMRKAALSLGAQTGFMKNIEVLSNKILESANELDSIYDFSFIMKLDSGSTNQMYQLPPVLRIAEKRFHKSSDNFITTSGVTYEIIKPARLVSNAPNWRQYLIFKPGSVIKFPHEVLMPKNELERELWSKWIDEGWERGVEQANFEMQSRVANLGDEFLGMVRYARLVKQGMITPAQVAESTQSIVGSGNQMIIDQKQVRIAAPASLNPDSKNWKAVIVDPRKSLRYPIEQKDKTEHKKDEE